METLADNSQVLQSRPALEPPPSADDQREEEIAESTVKDFSIIMGGPVYNLVRRSRFVRQAVQNVSRKVAVVLAVTWLPLLLLSLKDGLAFGHLVRIPFLYDFTVYGRLLIGIPLLLLAEILIEPQVRQAVKEFLKARLVPEQELPAFENVLLRVEQMRDSWFAEAIVLVLAFFPILLFQHEWDVGVITNWHTTANGLSAAGWFYAVVCAPIMRYITYRWVFRYLLWAILLWRISRLQLILIPTHPDRAAGLNFLSITQKHFGILASALCCSVSGRVANVILFEGKSLSSLKYPLLGFVALSVIAGLLPLAFWAPRLKKVRTKGLLDYGRLAKTYTESFDRKWVHYAARPSEQLLGTPDMQSLADLGNSFAFVEKMQWAPVSKKLVKQLVWFTALPLLPVIVYATPTAELIRQVMHLIT